MLTPLAAKALSIAESQIGVIETSHNMSPEIAQYWHDCGWVPKAVPWCAVYVCAMVKRACDALGMPVPFKLAPGVFTLDEDCPRGLRTLTPRAGCIFILNGHKHTGFVTTSFPNQNCLTVEGNTNADGSPEGNQVARHSRGRSELLTFIDLNLV